MHDLNRQRVGAKKASETTNALLSVFGLAPVDDLVVRSALAMRWPDFENAVTAAAASRARCVAIVTRNLRDFRRSPVRALSPTEVVACLEVS